MSTMPSSPTYVLSQSIDQFPANAFVVQNGKVFIDCSLVAGIACTSLDQDFLPEFCFKLHLGLSSCQTIYNATKPTGQKFAVWAVPQWGIAQYYDSSQVATPGYYSLTSWSGSSLIKNDINTVLPNLQ